MGDYKNSKFILDDTRILINLHQTPSHHTFEELRVLPALLRGIVVIAEVSPLHTSIPYYEYIVWSHINSMATTIRNVSANYNSYYEKFHGPQSKLGELIQTMRDKAKNHLKEAIINLHK